MCDLKGWASLCGVDLVALCGVDLVAALWEAKLGLLLKHGRAKCCAAPLPAALPSGLAAPDTLLRCLPRARARESLLAQLAAVCSAAAAAAADGLGGCWA